MKKIFMVLLFAAPAGAHAMGMHGMRFYGHSSAGAHLAAALYALMAVLGYWVLHHAAREKDTVAYVKRAGLGVGWLLVAVGLMGLLCAVTSHVGRNSRCGGDRPEWNMQVEEDSDSVAGERTIKVQLNSKKKTVKN